MIDEINEFDFGAFKNHVLTHQKLIEASEIKAGSSRFPAINIARFAFTARVSVLGEVISIKGCISRKYPMDLPMFWLENPEQLGFTPHIAPGGDICYHVSEGLVIDRKRPLDVFDAALSKLISDLEKGKDAPNQDDFLNEIEFYWGYHPDANHVVSNLNLEEGMARRVWLGKYSSNDPALQEHSAMVVSDSKSGLDELVRSPTSKARISSAFFISLPKEAKILPPRWMAFWSDEEFNKLIIGQLSPSNIGILERLRNSESLDEENFFISIALPNGGRALVGVRRSKKELNKGQFRTVLTPLIVTRFDPQYLIERGGGDKDTVGKHVLVIGCGAIGGQVAMELAKSGISHLTLCDSDLISTDNIHRHLIGFDNAIFCAPKAHMVMMEIHHHIRHIEVQSHASSIEDLLLKKKVNLNEFDLIISATGSMTTDLFLNDAIRQLEKTPPCIFTWVEPLGLGGHVLLTNNGDTPGCLNCLFTKGVEDKEFEFHNRSAFAAPGQFFGKTTAGCTSYFTPFSSLDANRTAIEAVRLAINYLKGKEPKNPLISWKGSKSEFEAHNWKVSPRFKFSQKQLIDYRYHYPTPNCDICREKFQDFK